MIIVTGQINVREGHAKAGCLDLASGTNRTDRTATTGGGRRHAMQFTTTNVSLDGSMQGGGPDEARVGRGAR